MNTILVANAGSSSVKFQVFGVEQDGSLKRQIKGQMDGVGSRPRLRATAADGSVLIDRNYENEAVPDVAAALTTAGACCGTICGSTRLPSATGSCMAAPITTGRSGSIRMWWRLERYVSLAPLHQPYNLAPIRSVLARFPDMPQVACFEVGDDHPPGGDVRRDLRQNAC
jgi:acetate kinase